MMARYVYVVWEADRGCGINFVAVYERLQDALEAVKQPNTYYEKVEMR